MRALTCGGESAELQTATSGTAANAKDFDSPAPAFAIYFRVN
jgi:hypothetical protein